MSPQGFHQHSFQRGIHCRPRKEFIDRKREKEREREREREKEREREREREREKKREATCPDIWILTDST